MNYDEMIDVIEAAKAGKTIEAKAKDGITEWHESRNPIWDFCRFDYRVKLSPVAAGHNPDKLTEEQVGISEGWRLLALNEVAIRGDEQLINGEWIKISVTYPIEKYIPCAVRTKRPLPPKGKRRVLSVSELPPFVQVRYEGIDCWDLVVCVCDNNEFYIANKQTPFRVLEHNADRWRWRGLDSVEREFWVEEAGGGR